MANTCYEMMLEYVSKDGNIVYYRHKIPMSKILRDIDRFSAGLLQLGLKKGDVVTLYLPSCPQGVVAFYACSKLGLVANIVHPLIPINLLRENLTKTNSKALLFYDVLAKNEHEIATLGQKLVRCSIADYVTVRKSIYSLYAKCTGKRLKNICTYASLLKNRTTTEILGDEKDVVCYMHSGGTGGEPKIVKLTNHAFNATALGMALMYHPNVDATCYNLTTLPIFHAYGLCSAIHTPMMLGVSLILVPQFKTKTVKRCLQKHKVVVWSVVPAMLKKMLKDGTFDNRRALSSLDVIWCGGDVLDESLVERVDGILSKYCPRAKLMRGYGLTEVCGVCIVNNYDHYRKNSCGMPMPTIEAQIWDDNGEVLPPNTHGEIVICSGGNMQGYIEGENCIVERDGKTWVKTGDIGYLDEQGFVYVVDRKKRSLKIAAVNVFPAQVEACVKQLDFVDEVCAVGHVHNEKQFLKVFVTLKSQMDTETVRRKVIEICQANLIPYSVPRFVEVISAMPRTQFGKIDYKTLEK